VQAPVPAAFGVGLQVEARDQVIGSHGRQYGGQVRHWGAGSGAQAVAALRGAENKAWRSDSYTVAGS
jgi:hypothetical protein